MRVGSLPKGDVMAATYPYPLERTTYSRRGSGAPGAERQERSARSGAPGAERQGAERQERQERLPPPTLSVGS